MLKKSKQLILGIVIGFVLASSVAFGADVIRNAYFNSDLKLAINGQEVEDIRIVTVELEGEQWGRNYYSIADLIKAINDYGDISAKVDFDSNTKTTIIEIEGQKKEDDDIMATPTPVPQTDEEIRSSIISIIEKHRQKEAENEPEPPKREENKPVVKRYTKDGIDILEVDGVKYVCRDVVFEQYKYVSLEFNSREKTLKLIDDSLPGTLNLTPETLQYFEEEIPWHDPIHDGKIYIKYDYYINVLVPKIEKLIKK